MTPLDVLSLNDAKSYLRVDFDDDDTLITDIIYGAVDTFEQRTQWRLYNRDEVIQVGNQTEVELFQFPLNSYSILDYNNSAGVVDFNATQYRVRTVIKFPYNYCYISETETPTIQLNVGYTDAANIPYGIKTWLKRCVTWFYENRNTNEISQSLDAELSIYKRNVLW